MEVQNKVGIISVYDSAFAHLPRTTIEHTRIYKKLKEFPYPKAKNSEIYHKVGSRWLLAQVLIFRLIINGNFDAYVLWTLVKRV